MDNLIIHKMKVAQEAIRSVGATPLYLPTHSPELNPIERWWADLKRDLRKMAIDDEHVLREAVQFLRGCMSHEIACWFRTALQEA